VAASMKWISKCLQGAQVTEDYKQKHDPTRKLQIWWLQVPSTPKVNK
jgi:hypothetical protein